MLKIVVGNDSAGVRSSPDIKIWGNKRLANKREEQSEEFSNSTLPLKNLFNC